MTVGPMMTMGDFATVVVAALAVAGLIYQVGRLSVRVETLEAWRMEAKDDLKAIRSSLDNISGAIGARKL